MPRHVGRGIASLPLAAVAHHHNEFAACRQCAGRTGGGAYSYGYGFYNPVKYIDPNGHCPFAGDNRDVVADCTQEQFENASWQERIDWLDTFAGLTGAGEWLHDVRGVITDIFKKDPNASFLSWALKGDAGVLLALENGWRGYNGNSPIGSDPQLQGAAATWSRFFSKLGAYNSSNRAQSDGDTQDIIAVRLQAEQQGADYAFGLARDVYDKLDPETRGQIDVFRTGADIYRHAAPSLRQLQVSVTGSAADYTDPRTSWPTLYARSQDLGPIGASILTGLYYLSLGDPVP